MNTDNNQNAVSYTESDVCNGCKFAVRKPESEIRNPWTRQFGCRCNNRVLSRTKEAMRLLETPRDEELDSGFLEKISLALKKGHAAWDCLDGLLRKGYMEPEDNVIQCQFRGI